MVSFVNPKNVPGMADAEDVVRGITPKMGVAYTALWLTKRVLSARCNFPKADQYRHHSALRLGEISVRNQKPHRGATACRATCHRRDV